MKLMSADEIQARRERGEPCANSVVQSGVDQDDKPVERTLTCDLLAGHDGQHQAIVAGNSTSEQLVWDKIRWGP